MLKSCSMQTFYILHFQFCCKKVLAFLHDIIQLKYSGVVYFCMIALRQEEALLSMYLVLCHVA